MSNSRRLFEATVGGYLAAFLVSAAALVAGGLPSLGTLVFALAVVGGVGAALAHESSAVRALASPGVAAVVVLAPLSLLWFPLVGRVSDSLVPVAAVGAGASGLGLLASITAAYCRNRDRISAATEYAAAEADDADDGLFSEVDSRAVAAGSLVLFGMTFAVAVATIADGGDLSGALTGFGALSTLFTLFDNSDPDRVAVTDAGLVVDGSLFDPETLVGATLEDGDLVVERTRFRSDVTVERDRFGDDGVSRLAAAVGQITDGPAGVEGDEERAVAADDDSRSRERVVAADDDSRSRERERA